MSETMQLNGTVGNWNAKKSALESKLFELGVGHLVGMPDGEVPTAPDALNDTN